MKALRLSICTALATASLSLSAVAQTDHNAHAPAAAPAPAAAARLSDGVVQKIDKPRQKVTLAHGPLSNGMPAMTMAFGVKDPSWLDQLKPGQKIRFAIAPDGALTIVRFEPVK